MSTAKLRFSVQTDDNFSRRLHTSTLDLDQDEAVQQGAQKASQLKWDRSKKRFVAGSGVGADNKKMIRSESGALLPASFNSGRYAKWKSESCRKHTDLSGDSSRSHHTLPAHSGSSARKTTQFATRRTRNELAPTQRSTGASRRGSKGSNQR
jgi:ATP-dependent RNA helicase DDX54/DBP10